MTCDTLCRCLETPHSDVLNQDTVTPTNASKFEPFDTFEPEVLSRHVSRSEFL